MSDPIVEHEDSPFDSTPRVNGRLFAKYGDRARVRVVGNVAEQRPFVSEVRT